MNATTFLLALLVAVAAVPAKAETLIVALSTQQVRISSNFTGSSITVFGAIERDAATVSRASFYDVVVVVKGPAETFVTRKKDRFLGVWLNRSSRTFVNVPSFYSVHSSRPLDQVTTPQLRKRYQLGADQLVFPVAVDGGAETAEAGDEFREAFIKLKSDARLYQSHPYAVSFPGAEIFQTAIDLPANVPTGRYVATVYLFRDGAMLASKEEPIIVVKTGFEQASYNLAQSQGFVYGLAVVVLAIFTGWLAGVIFRRD